ncbi:plasmid transfer protein [Streptomyces bathyalis]|uniref:Plasmid transfer protein n=1 Tax=Streptomyces bathyalis TaxID=2710756 RepID=A0A7T1T700_9ACTN|nr:FtsK/SpoIIIE domain-containing protein [Streptomyces bathyalis]QPP07576.1 plasmid transfer protein [Streptomyces bathyalis]
MTGIVITVVIVGGLALLLKWRRPAWYWLAFGALIASVRVLVTYGSVMDACNLTVSASRFRIMVARWFKKAMPPSRVPRIRRLRITRTGLVLRIRMRPGQDAFEYAAASDRLRHSFGMRQVTAREVRSGTVELAMTGYDILKRVQMPAKVDDGLLKVAVAMADDGSVAFRDYRRTPHALTLGATQSGKSVYQRRLVTALAPQPVALVGIDCKQGVELAPLARRLSALATTPEEALGLLEALVERMEGIYQVIRREQRISADIPDAEITADIWGLPEKIRPVPVVLTIDEVAELALVATRAEEKRRNRIVTALVRLAQLGRAAGIYLDIYGQRFGSELGDGITMLRAQLSGRTAHRVNDESSAKMAFGDINPDAVFAAIQIATGQPGTAITADATGSWSRIRTPHTTLRQAVNACNRHAHLTPHLPELADFRPALDLAPGKAAPAIESVTEAA